MIGSRYLSRALSTLYLVQESKASFFMQQECLMRMRKNWLAALAITLVVGTGLIVGGSRSWAADDEDKEIAEAVRKIAKAVAANKPDEAKKEAEALVAKTKDLGDVMNMFKARKNGGLGIGPKPGAIMPDGIEAKVIALAKKKLTAAEVKNHAPDLEQMGHDIAAISYVGDVHTPKKKVAAKDPKDWTKWMDEMRKGANDLSKAAKAQDATGIKNAAMKANASCSNCHGVFRD
jgi:hypothetical protein